MSFSDFDSETHIKQYKKLDFEITLEFNPKHLKLSITDILTQTRFVADINENFLKNERLSPFFLKTLISSCFKIGGCEENLTFKLFFLTEDQLELFSIFRKIDEVKMKTIKLNSFEKRADDYYGMLMSIKIENSDFKFNLKIQLSKIIKKPIYQERQYNIERNVDHFLINSLKLKADRPDLAERNVETKNLFKNQDEEEERRREFLKKISEFKKNIESDKRK